MRDKETITIPLNKVSYEDLEALTIEQQTQLFVKDKEIERLNNIINKIDEYVNKLRYYADEDDDGYKISKDIHNIIQEVKGSDKE